MTQHWVRGQYVAPSTGSGALYDTQHWYLNIIIEGIVRPCSVLFLLFLYQNPVKYIVLLGLSLTESEIQNCSGTSHLFSHVLTGCTQKDWFLGSVFDKTVSIIMLFISVIIRVDNLLYGAMHFCFPPSIGLGFHWSVSHDSTWSS